MHVEFEAVLGGGVQHSGQGLRGRRESYGIGRCLQFVAPSLILSAAQLGQLLFLDAEANDEVA